MERKKEVENPVSDFTHFKYLSFHIKLPFYIAKRYGSNVEHLRQDLYRIIDKYSSVKSYANLYEIVRTDLISKIVSIKVSRILGRKSVNKIMRYVNKILESNGHGEDILNGDIYNYLKSCIRSNFLLDRFVKYDSLYDLIIKSIYRCVKENKKVEKSCVHNDVVSFVSYNVLRLNDVIIHRYEMDITRLINLYYLYGNTIVINNFTDDILMPYANTLVYENNKIKMLFLLSHLFSVQDREIFQFPITSIETYLLVLMSYIADEEMGTYDLLLKSIYDRNRVPSTATFFCNDVKQHSTYINSGITPSFFTY